MVSEDKASSLSDLESEPTGGEKRLCGRAMLAASSWEERLEPLRAAVSCFQADTFAVDSDEYKHILNAIKYIQENCGRWGGRASE